MRQEMPSNSELPASAPLAAVEPLTMSTIRQHLSAGQGRRYWRSLEELADTDEFHTFLQREFPREASVWDDRSFNRRNFLHLMAASLAFAGMSGGCTPRESEVLMPYVRAPKEITPGKTLQYATTFPNGASSLGLLVTSTIGRPIKIEGNPQHPASLGATDAIAQASILSLYDPDRSQTIRFLGEISTWNAFLTAIRSRLTSGDGTGAGLHILTEPVTSPTLARQMRVLRKRFPQARVHEYSVGNRHWARAAARTALTQDVTPVYDFEAARTVMSLDCDFLCGEAAGVRYARQFMAGRQVVGASKAHQPHAPGTVGQGNTASHAGTPLTMNRLYQVETMYTPTGVAADHRLPLPPSGVIEFAVALAVEFGLQEFKPYEKLGQKATFDPANNPDHKQWVQTTASDLRDNRGRSLVLAGDHQSEIVHLIAMAINNALENVGKTVRYVPAVERADSGAGASSGGAAIPAAGEYSWGESTHELNKLIADLDGGSAETLIILDVNAVYNSPAVLGFADALSKFSATKGKLAVHFGLYEDETSRLCQWHVPATHYLESWGDARAFDGTASLIQPLIAPLYEGRNINELLSVLIDPVTRKPLEIVRDTWQKEWADDFEKTWARALHDGVIADSAFQAAEVKFAIDEAKLDLAIAVVGANGTSNFHNANPKFATNVGNKLPAPVADGLEVLFLPDPHIGDGRWANNGWLQELPKPLSKLTWDNAVFISPATAKRLQVASEDLVRLDLNGRSVTGPICVLPGHANDCVTLHYGYGRKQGGRTAVGAGFNAYEIAGAYGLAGGAHLKLSKTGDKYPLAITQLHHNVEGRNIVHSGTLSEYQRDPRGIHRAAHAEHEGHHPPSLFPEVAYDGFKWGMAINMTSCIGCNACVVACQAENNIPVVGKEQVIAGREMHWLRIDTYHEGTADDPKTALQPMLCQHCELAPCEVVCPVAATTHSPEGLNEMTYNRCVGTRYCSNNCPYKVRRFNFLQYTDETTPVLKLLNNPDVTVRSRGVMEKCTYCVQRINHARIDAKNLSMQNGQPVTIPDGSLLTACQQVCPTQAIVFGDLNDPNSEVTRRQSDPLNYSVLAELGTRPRTTYLAKLTNPHPDLI